MKTFGSSMTEEKFRKKLLAKTWLGALLLLIGIATIILSNTMRMDEHQQSFLSGVGSGMTAAMIVMIIGFVRILKNPKKFHAFYVKTNDERNGALQRKALVITSFGTLLIVYLVVILGTMGVITWTAQTAALIIIATWFVFYLSSCVILNKWY
jgi:Na+-transporting NADH:ubiquinone oxidoreductase subunit NqrD